MKISLKHVALLALALSLLAGGMSLAQTGGDFDLSWWTVDGGGGVASGDGFGLTGSVGQPEMAPALTGGDFTLTSGFWPGESSGGEPPACDRPLTSVDLSGPASGETGETLTFVASVTPANASEPITYTWSSDGLVGSQANQATYLWTSAGNKSVQVSARNCGGQDFDASQPVAISLACKAIADVSIAGLASGYTGVVYTFSALPEPGDASEPLTYTWTVDGLVGGQGTANATYSWATTGVHTASVSVENCGGSANEDHAITLSDPPPTCTHPIAGVTISGPATGNKDTDYTFVASVEPSNATAPIAYAWSTDGLVGGQGTLSATYRWSQVGAYDVAVSVGNCGGSDSDVHTIEISQGHVYLPIVLCTH